MKRAFSSFVAIALVGAIAVPVMAQTVTDPSVATFNNGYLAKHPAIAQQLNQNPGLLDNQQFLASHPGLQNYLTNHPQARTELQQHPGRFMNGMNGMSGYGRNQNGNGSFNQSPVARFDNGYLDQHPEVAQQLASNPRLVDNQQYLASHPELKNYLTNHPQVRTDLLQHPQRFMNSESRYEQHEPGLERQENGSGLSNRGAVSRFDNGYLDQHPNTARQLGQNPSLVNNQQFLNSHPGLENYLGSHPQVRSDLQQHPGGFMNAEQRYERSENNANANGRGRMRQFGNWRRGRRGGW